MSANLHPLPADILATATKLLADYDAWDEDRGELSAAEQDGPTPGSGSWHDSDDTGCALAGSLAHLLRTLTVVPAAPVIPEAVGRRDCYGCDAALVDTATECWQCKAETEADGEEYEADLGDPYLLCMGCGIADGIYEDEKAARWTALGHRDHGSTTLTADGLVQVQMDYSGHGDFDGEGFVCEGPVGKLSHPVTIPDHWKLNAY